MTVLLTAFLEHIAPYVLAGGAALIGAIGLWVHGRISGSKAQANADKAKEADAYAKHIKDISDAANARPTGSLSDDPANRDR